MGIDKDKEDQMILKRKDPTKKKDSKEDGKGEDKIDQ